MNIGYNCKLIEETFKELESKLESKNYIVDDIGYYYDSTDNRIYMRIRFNLCVTELESMPELFESRIVSNHKLFDIRNIIIECDILKLLTSFRMNDIYYDNITQYILNKILYKWANNLTALK